MFELEKKGTQQKRLNGEEQQQQKKKEKYIYHIWGVPLLVSLTSCLSFFFFFFP
jgi:hypothetical protein